MNMITSRPTIVKQSLKELDEYLGLRIKKLEDIQTKIPKIICNALIQVACCGESIFICVGIINHEGLHVSYCGGCSSKISSAENLTNNIDQSIIDAVLYQGALKKDFTASEIYKIVDLSKTRVRLQLMTLERKGIISKLSDNMSIDMRAKRMQVTGLDYFAYSLLLTFHLFDKSELNDKYCHTVIRQNCVEWGICLETGHHTEHKLCCIECYQIHVEAVN